MNKLIFKDSTVEYENKNGDLSLVIRMKIKDGYSSRKVFNNGFTTVMTSIKRKLQANLNKIDVGNIKIEFLKKIIKSKRTCLRFKRMMVDDIKITDGPNYVIIGGSVEGELKVNASMLRTDWTLFKVVHYEWTGEKNEQ